MIDNMLNALFGCRHRKMTRPITTVHRPGTRSEGAYVACLDCGRRFNYDVDAMRVGEPQPVAQAQYRPLTNPFQIQ